MKRMTYISIEQRTLIDHLAAATARIHKVAAHHSHLSAEGRRCCAEWQRAKDELLAAPCGRKLWSAYCNLYQYNPKTVGLDFFI